MQFIDLKSQYSILKEDINKRIQNVLDSGAFINGPELKELEEKLAAYTGVKHAIGCASGTDALLVPLLAYGIKPGDEIITTPFTFIATAEVVSFIGAVPVFVDVDPDNYNIDIDQIEKKITKKTKGIIPVSLYGQTPDMDKINAIAKKHGLFVIEDGAQSFGAVYKGKKSCSLTDVGATSFYPSKPLGCYGDGGMMFTNDDKLAEKMRSIINHGQTERYKHKYIGFNFRLDTIQAAVLLSKFTHFEEEAENRKAVGARYNKLFEGTKAIPTKIESYTGRCVYAQYSIRVKNRQEVLDHLKTKNIPTAVHYPIPIHIQEAYTYLGGKKGDCPVSERTADEIMSLPMHPFLSEADQDMIVKTVLEIAR